MFSTIKSAFTASPTPATKPVRKIVIPTVESKFTTLRLFGHNEAPVSSLESGLNRVGLSLLNSNPENHRDYSAQPKYYIVRTKDRAEIATIVGDYETKMVDDPTPEKPWNRKEVAMGKIIIEPFSGVDASSYNDAINVVTSWANDKLGGKKRRSKTQKKKRASRKTRHHSR